MENGDGGFVDAAVDTQDTHICCLPAWLLNTASGKNKRRIITNTFFSHQLGGGSSSSVCRSHQQQWLACSHTPTQQLIFSKFWISQPSTTPYSQLLEFTTDLPWCIRVLQWGFQPPTILLLRPTWIKVTTLWSTLMFCVGTKFLRSSCLAGWLIFVLAHAHMYVYFYVWAGSSSSSTVIPWKNVWQTWRTSHVAAEQKLKSLASSNDGYACICACVLFNWIQREDVWTQSCGMPVLDLWFHYLQWLALLCTFPKATQSRWTLLLLSLLLLHQILC